ncbi:hypothetical protein [Pseudomonas sp. B28(2017)]|uniref:hypothetical protein n=1 Tax=Pseudomonas sp. B28(2017) TaxID=1981730 RepID=UPI0013020E40|nr:hypothetical protein [Pseudomonas sp. B28(2017)]
MRTDTSNALPDAIGKGWAEALSGIFSSASNFLPIHGTNRVRGAVAHDSRSIFEG